LGAAQTPIGGASPIYPQLSTSQADQLAGRMNGVAAHCFSRTDSMMWSISSLPNTGGVTLLERVPCYRGRSGRFDLPDQPGGGTSQHVRPSARLKFVVVGTAVHFGLAVLGWGGFEAFFSHPALTALAIALFALSGVAFFAGGNLSPGVREDRGNRWVLAAFALIGLLDAYLPAYTDRKEFWTLDGNAIRWLGVALFAAGGALRLWPVFVLGHRFSGLVAIQPGHTLVTNGVYGIIRHPSYLGLLINSLGWALAFRSVVGVLVTALTISPLLARINAEEAMLRAEFGAEYDAYRARTSRLIPGLY
jgi:protein-S-isoprenylcysteine O-methyltransferase Ste14